MATRWRGPKSAYGCSLLPRDSPPRPPWERRDLKNILTRLCCLPPLYRALVVWKKQHARLLSVLLPCVLNVRECLQLCTQCILVVCLCVVKYVSSCRYCTSQVVPFVKIVFRKLFTLHMCHQESLCAEHERIIYFRFRFLCKPCGSAGRVTPS